MSKRQNNRLVGNQCTSGLDGWQMGSHYKNRPTMNFWSMKEANGRHSGLFGGPLGLGIMPDSQSRRTKIGSNGLTVAS